MRTYILTMGAIAIAIILSGCGAVSHGMAGLTGYSKVCVDGVSYLQFASGVTVQYDRLGNVAECN